MSWAKALEGRWVLHTDTGLIDQVKKFWSGEEGDRHREDHFALFEMKSGHTLVASDETLFVPLSDDEHQFYKLSEGVIAHSIKETITLGANSGKITLQSACVLIEAALTAQLRALHVKNKS